LAVGPRPSRQHVVEPVLGNLRREAPGARKDGIDPFQHVRRAQHVVAAPFETGDTGVDCDDLTIFAGSILKNLNIPFYIRIVKIDKEDFLADRRVSSLLLDPPDM